MWWFRSSKHETGVKGNAQHSTIDTSRRVKKKKTLQHSRSGLTLKRRKKRRKLLSTRKPLPTPSSSVGSLRKFKTLKKKKKEAKKAKKRVPRGRSPQRPKRSQRPCSSPQREKVRYKTNQPVKSEWLFSRAVQALGIQRLRKFLSGKRPKSSPKPQVRPRRRVDKPTPTMQSTSQAPRTLIQRTLQVAKAAWATKPRARGKGRRNRRRPN